LVREIEKDFPDSNKGWGVVVERYADVIVGPETPAVGMKPSLLQISTVASAPFGPDPPVTRTRPSGSSAADAPVRSC